ncbi:SDR family NAD(P)-dependent oxidoreductase [Mycobacteroides chelonae]|uniref:SDR family NAD(P)-dependent oxidoreductase n=1 Tax=Mycobacteroides chelonae TaxID=1774 RepID=UPI0039E93D2D
MSQRAVLITGGARGIGAATAAAFLEAGARVALGDLDAPFADRKAAELAKRYGDRVRGLPLDVTDRASFEGFFDVAASAFGNIDTLVNNAGIMPTGLLHEEADTLTDQVLRVNLTGVINGCKIAASRFERGASIVNIASASALFGAPAMATYCASKAAVLMFTESLRLELAQRDIHVMAVLPGLVNTELSAGANYPKALRRFVAVEPHDVAEAVVTGVRRARSTVSVPKSLRAMLFAADLLPQGARRRAEQAAGVHTAFAHAHPEARAAYHARISKHDRYGTV